MRRRLSFGPFTLDPDTRQLLHGVNREAVHLSLKAYELLTVLVEARPRALSKRELHERLWPTTFVSEATLASLIAELREALGERGREGRFVRTVHGFGYSFVAEVNEPAAAAIVPTRNWIICNGQERPLADGEHVIGRDPGAAIDLHSPLVSRQHAKIVVANDVATIEDLGSKNGTFLRGQPVTAPIPLVDGDQIRIGAFELTFRTMTGRGSTETLR